MKLGRSSEPRSHKPKAGEVLRFEAEPVFDLRAVVLAQADLIRNELADSSSELEPIIFMSSKGYHLANIRALETGLGMRVLTPEQEAAAAAEVRTSISQLNADHLVRMQQDPRKFAVLAAWSQLYPEDRHHMTIDDQRFIRTLKTIAQRPNDMNYIRRAVFLLHLRPDKRDDIRGTVTAQYFEDFVIGQFKERYLISKKGVGKFVEWMADYLLIHPEDRQRFALTEAEKQIVETDIRDPRPSIWPMAGRLRDVAIVLGEEARIDDRGVVQISYHKPGIAQSRPLPDRPLA